MLYFIVQQRSRGHFNLLILLSCNFNNFVTLTKHKFRTPWRWCRCIETCRSAYRIQNIVYIYVVLLLIWKINCMLTFKSRCFMWDIYVWSENLMLLWISGVLPLAPPTCLHGLHRDNFTFVSTFSNAVSIVFFAL
jgi:hypothetical protein